MFFHLADTFFHRIRFWDLKKEREKPEENMREMRLSLCASVCAIDDDFSHHIKRRRGECTQVYKQWR